MGILRPGNTDVSWVLGMASFDVFSGDAVGLCGLQQLRLSERRSATVGTGVKRDTNVIAGWDICGEHARSSRGRTRCRLCVSSFPDRRRGAADCRSRGFVDAFVLVI